MNMAKRLRLLIRRIVEAKTATHTIHYVEMTPEQQKNFDAAFEAMDGAFKEMDKAFAALRKL